MGQACVAVAYSGGRDSSALLHATLVSAGPLGIRVVALHVHHGLSRHADEWLTHCELQCARWAKRGWPVVFASFRVGTRPAAAESVEAWARTARYRALREMAMEQGASLVMLAHHRRDQAETFLLQALRGAGPAGLSSMPVRVVREGITWARPWLARPREDIDSYVSRHRIKFVRDDSNDDLRYARNRLRLQLWPALVKAFPQAERAFADSAHRAQEASACLFDLANQDLLPLATNAGALDVKAWFNLSAARRSNALRAWLRRLSTQAASASLVTRLMTELRPDSNARWPLAAGELRAYRGVLCFADLDTSPHHDTPRENQVSVCGAGEFCLPGWGGCLQVRYTPEGGVPLAWLGRLDLKARLGAEKFQSGVGRPPRSLKKQYQAGGIPAWDRQGPLFYSGGQLVFVPGLGLDARVLALPGQEQVSLRWLPLVAE